MSLSGKQPPSVRVISGPVRVRRPTKNVAQAQVNFSKDGSHLPPVCFEVRHSYSADDYAWFVRPFRAQPRHKVDACGNIAGLLSSWLREYDGKDAVLRASPKKWRGIAVRAVWPSGLAMLESAEKIALSSGEIDLAKFLRFLADAFARCPSFGNDEMTRIRDLVDYGRCVITDLLQETSALRSRPAQWHHDIASLSKSHPHLLQSNRVPRRVLVALLAAREPVSTFALAGGKGASGGARRNCKRALEDLEKVGLAKRVAGKWTCGPATRGV
jgi:hypothetical protein